MIQSGALYNDKRYYMPKNLNSNQIVGTILEQHEPRSNLWNYEEVLQSRSRAWAEQVPCLGGVEVQHDLMKCLRQQSESF